MYSDRINNKRYRAGFTLVELIAVMVILAIVSALGSSFLISTMDTYHTVQQRTKLLTKARVAVEQMTRYLRSSLPNSVRISGSGNCIEFLPIVAGANYLNDVPDSSNGAPLTNGINTAPFTINSAVGTAINVVIGGNDPSEIFTLSSPSARVSISGTSGDPITSVSLAANHRFLRNSISRRLYLTGSPIRFCLSGTELVMYSNYGLLTSSIDDSNPGGNSALMANNIASAGNAFTLSAGSEDRNARINIGMQFSQNETQVSINHQVLIRNVP